METSIGSSGRAQTPITAAATCQVMVDAAAPNALPITRVRMGSPETDRHDQQQQAGQAAADQADCAAARRCMRRHAAAGAQLGQFRIEGGSAGVAGLAMPSATWRATRHSAGVGRAQHQAADHQGDDMGEGDVDACC